MIEVEKLIGNTPLIKIDGIFVKCEFTNLTGSIKDRIALMMLYDIPRNKTIVEVSSGNTGISLACLYKALGFTGKCIIYIPKSTSNGKYKSMLKYDASLVLCDNIKDCMDNLKNDLQMFENSVWLNQFSNDNNVSAQKIMAHEIYWQLVNLNSSYYPTDIITGIGTGGTLAGLFHIFPDATYHTFNCIDGTIEGTSDGVPLPLKPKDCNLVIHDITMNEVKTAKDYLLYDCGIDVGFSSAANFVVARKIYASNNSKKVLTIFTDLGDRYE